MKQVPVVKYLKNRHSFRRNSVTPGDYTTFKYQLYTFSTLNTLEWYFLVWPNRPDLLAKITGLVHSVQEYLNSCFARLCSFNPSDVKTLLHSDMPLDPGVFHCVVPNFGWLNMLFHKWNTQKPQSAKMLIHRTRPYFSITPSFTNKKNWKYAKRKLYLYLS